MFDSSSVNFQLHSDEWVDLDRVDIARLRVKLPYTQRGSARYATLSLVPYVRSLIVISRRRRAFMYLSPCNLMFIY